MTIKRVLLIVSICLAVAGLLIWLLTPALVYRDYVHGTVRATINGTATIFGGNIVLKGSNLTSKILKLSPVLLISFILLLAGIGLAVARMFMKKNLILMIATTVCFAIVGILCFFTKQLAVPVHSGAIDSLDLAIVGQIFTFICLAGAAVTSAIKEK